jgi:hypothetical protein
MDEITRGLAKVERVNKEAEEARRLEEIRLKEEYKRKAIHEQIKKQQEEELKMKIEEELRKRT